MANTEYPSATPQSQPSGSRGNRNLIIGVLAAALLVSWGFLLWSKNKSTKEKQELKTESANYFSQRDSIKMLYDQAEMRLDSITSTNNQLSGKLTDREKDINNLKTQIRGILAKKNATAAELSKAKDMIGQLNDKIAGLEAEVARLTGENQQLTAANAGLTQEKADLQTNLQSAQTENESLAKTVDIGSTFSASNIQITSLHEKKNGKEKSTSTAKRVDKLVVSFDVENRIAQSGPADMYVIVTGPDGKVIADSAHSMLTTRTEGDRAYTAKVSIQYDQGTRKNVSYPIRNSSFQTGDYKIEIYHNGFKIGEGTRTLKKGGLFG